MSAWWFGVNNSRESRAEGAAGHMHYRDVVPLLRDGTTITWPFGGAPGSRRLYAEMEAGDDVVLWMGDGVEAAWGILGLAEVEALDAAGQQLSLRRAGGPWKPITPYQPGKPTETANTKALLRIFGNTYGPLRKLWKKLGVAGVEQKVVTIERVSYAQLHELSKLLTAIPATTSGSTGSSPASALALPPATRRILATTAAFIRQRRPGSFFAKIVGSKLNVHCGGIIAMTATPGSIWLALAKPDGVSRVEGLASWTWDDGSLPDSYPEYKRPTPTRNGYYDPATDLTGMEWASKIGPAFFDYLETLCSRGPAPDHRTLSTPGLCEEIARWGDQESEAASFEQAVRIACRSGAEERRARLGQAPRKPTVFSTVVNLFQRNPDVVAEVLARAAGVCELCGQPAPFVRASDGTPYLEVHHTVRLADGGDDTVENAVAACPNCHRGAHFG